MPAAAARGRKPAPANRSRQQLQRERALQLAVQKNPGAASPGLPPQQQLSRPPPKEKPGPSPDVPPGDPAVEVEGQQKPGDVKPTENHHPAPQDAAPAVKELEKPEVELSVCF